MNNYLVIKTATVKSILLFTLVFFLVFAFPLQVIFSTPLPSMMPYVLLMVLFLLSFGKSYPKRLVIWNMHKPLIMLISIYIIFVLFNTAWQFAFGFISPEESVSIVVVYLLPILFFVYFRALAVEEEFRTLLLAIAIIGLLIGAHFVVDTYNRIVLLQVSDYDLMVIEYLQGRSGAAFEDMNKARLAIGARSHGLLAKHSITAAWIVFGCFATLTLIPRRAKLKRMLTISAYWLMLFIGQNYTSIIGFMFVILFIELKGFRLFRWKIPKGLIKFGIFAGAGTLIATLLYMFGLVSLIWFDKMSDLIALQIDLATGAKVYGDSGSFFGTLISNLLYFENPLGILIGNGFGSYGVALGGDFGIDDTLKRFGIPFSIAVFIGFLILIKKVFRFANNNEMQDCSIRYLWFAAILLSYIIFNEVHYSIWADKSILPVFFIALAIFDRYLVVELPKQGPFISEKDMVS